MKILKILFLSIISLSLLSLISCDKNIDADDIIIKDEETSRALNKNISISFAKPINGSTVTGGDLGVVVNASLPGGSIKNVILYINDDYVRGEGSAPYEWGTENTNKTDEKLLNLPSGSYKLKALVNDTNNGSAQKTITVNVVNGNTYAIITSPANNSTFDSSQNIEVDIDAQDPDGVKVVRLWLDGDYYDLDNESPFKFNLSNLDPGEHTLLAKAKDTNDNVTDSETITFTVENGGGGNEKPVVSFTQPANNSKTSDNNPGVIVDASDPDGIISYVELYINNDFVRKEGIAPYEWGKANSNKTDSKLLNLSNGTYSLKAIAFDNDGASKTAIISVTIENDSDQILRVLCLNTERTKVFRDSTREAAFHQLLLDSTPDILSLQEVAYDNNSLGLTKSDIQNYINRFPNYGISKWYFDLNFRGNCTISAYPIKLAENYPGTHERVYYVLLDTPGRDTLVINVHYGPGGNMPSFSGKTREIVTKTQAGTLSGVPKNAAIIFAGDANFKPTNPSYNTLTSVMEDTYASTGDGRIDYIMYVKDHLNLLEKYVWTKAKVSDHRPLFARFQLNN